jgi:predicted nucleotidyltransferase component of viral defense system
VQGYSQESAIAEKLQAMVALGEINSRMKDFYDVWLLAMRFAFEEAVLAKAITATFQWRHTAVPIAPIIFTPDFAHNRTRQTQWHAFLDRHRLDDAPREFGTVIEVLAAFLQPVLEAYHHGQSSHRHWLPGGPWHDHE